MSEYIVSEKAQRPANMNGKCFYCNQPIGQSHDNDCVLIKKRVTVRMSIEYDITIPAFWESGDIEYHRNEGTWCSQNAIHELENLVANGDCLCGRMIFQHIKDSSDEFIAED